MRRELKLRWNVENLEVQVEDDELQEPLQDDIMHAPPPVYDDPLAKGKAAAGTSKGNQQPTITPFSLHPRDPDNFLKLTTALNLFLLETISEDQIQHADRLIREYGQELIAVRVILYM